ncbi:SGNH/GDSL hydrolase family protein [Aetokthonos hydrillicola Thurmond2011]|jgi:lysophospholipase L1-like esterase|uniref:SGNH/GDSL hydrolase family protein n=1 Tax=Aetokthonos hydrillicola Thurmond2011 TaxID=2712845 RepID=A0AAP5IBR5_9CYAN|nr:SGNH/GDSL hydrolase family protein [Aetokthonos hydrillicola]MBO3460449.1 lipolytic protein G-D-S-L family [Aetokthonos hydrillicola CCALA 1050]MBW4588474.1 lipolytic protein G-D-S-L family [Aetokthonos hydrillicola CCALA 1050]MDR9896803.1 SGNH/GDSL hydrolase family protein [Aetokthonos hydrillicola Thurmond2011]
MRDVYLLVAGLLTILAIPASALSQLSIIQQPNHSVLWDLSQDLNSTVNEKIVPASDRSPELRNDKFQIPFNPNNHPANTQLIVSGSQLYYQRLTALQASESYTHLADKNLQPLWKSARKHQLTYEDWKNLLAIEAKAISQSQSANHLGILLGDSLSMWFPKDKLPNSKFWLNQGISGDTSEGILKRLSAFSSTKPDVIYIMAGINDLRKGTRDQAILSNHRQIIRRLRREHPKTRIIIQSILPTRLPTIPNARIRRINYQLALIAHQEGANYLNLYNWFTDFQGNLREDLTTDGLHLSQPGYEVWHFGIQQMELWHGA